HNIKRGNEDDYSPPFFYLQCFLILLSLEDMPIKLPPPFAFLRKPLACQAVELEFVLVVLLECAGKPAHPRDCLLARIAAVAWQRALLEHPLYVGLPQPFLALHEGPVLFQRWGLPPVIGKVT